MVSEEAIEITGEKPSKRGTWQFPTKPPRKNRRRIAHLMCGEEKTFCGTTLTHTKPANRLGEWDPEEHLDCVCSRCIEWWRNMKPSKCTARRESSPSHPS